MSFALERQAKGIAGDLALVRKAQGRRVNALSLGAIQA
jgi:hypothetical protein